jgi:glutamate carboxypeptidase
MTLDPWVAAAAPAIAARAERELEALVGVSSPSGDRKGAEEAVAVCAALLAAGPIAIERIPCSSPDHAPDLLARLEGDGDRRLLLLGHLDTVVSHEAHAPLTRDDGRLRGSGAIDMKGGVVLALGALRALAGEPPMGAEPASRPRFAEVALLLVNDEEWRRHPFAHAERFAGWDACLCFEAGERGPGGEEGVVVRRKAAGTLRVAAHGASAHSGSAPDRGRNALLALAAAAQEVAARHEPTGGDRLSAVPTILRSGDAFNVVPAAGELFCDLRADRLEAIEPVLDAVPDEVGGARLEAELVRRWPGMDSREATRALLAAGSERLGRPIVGAERGGASDASHLASHVELCIDGLGPRGGGAHAPEEYVLAESLPARAEVALALVAALLDAP